MQNICIMEELTRLQINLALLRKHQAGFEASPTRTVDVEVVALRVGGFVLLTFPGELTVPIGLELKQQSPHKPTFLAGYTNGYIYYCPTASQMENVGYAQEDSDCVLAPSGTPSSRPRPWNCSAACDGEWSGVPGVGTLLEAGCCNTWDRCRLRS